MFDVFFLDKTKPNLFLHEQHVSSLEQACQLSKTRFFWIVTYLCDYQDWDFLWEPPPWQKHQRHAWKSQWQKDSGTYLVPKQGFVDTNYHDAPIIIRTEQYNNLWQGELHNWDLSWHHDPTDPPYIYQFGTQHQATGGPRYVIPGAGDVKYISFPKYVKQSIDPVWSSPDGIDEDFDYTWHPDDRDPPYIYQFGTQHQQTGGPRYNVPGATEFKYVTQYKAKKISVDDFWEIPDGIDEDFDYTWHPDDRDPPYIYQFGTQHQQTGGPRYVVPGATEIKYVPNLKANKIFVDTTRWEIPDGIDEDFDYTWHPDDRDPPYIYQFGTQHQQTGGPRYVVPGATEVKYVTKPRASRVIVDKNWMVPDGIDDFDYTWHPDDRDPPYIYQFGTQHQQTGGPRYVVPGATEVKYVQMPRATVTTVNKDNWQIPEGISDDFDYTWHPDDRDPLYIYQFGTQHQQTGGPRYVVAGASEVKYVSSPRASRVMIDACWNVPENTNREAFDWTWHPDDRDPPYIYQFGTQWNRAGGPTYTVPGATDVKYSTAQTAKMLPSTKNWSVPDGIDINSFDFSWTPDPTQPPYIYQFGTQHQRTGGPRYVVPGATEIKFVTQPRATKIQVDPAWEVPPATEFDEEFDWTWHPDDQDPSYIYQFGTQHQRTGGPRYVVPGATEVKYVDQLRLNVKKTNVKICVIDHMCGNLDRVLEQIKQKAEVVKVSRYVDSYLGTLQRLAANLDQEEFIWICSSVCDYSDFDFTWYPEQWQASMLHVFASGNQKFGDTFYMHVPTFRDRSAKCQLLEWYDVNYVETSVSRWPMPVIQHQQDCHVDAVKTTSWQGPLALFTNQSVEEENLPVVPLWREKVKTVVPISNGAGSIVVPKCAVPYIKEQIYDYPNIDKTHIKRKDQPLDVVFISNGESTAEQAWMRLNESLVFQKNNLHRIDGVNGRVAAYQAAARTSTTPWFFAVFAKLFVADFFDWYWQPDRMQQPKHYIFHARNPVNGLEYGHQAMIAYNRELVLANTGQGLDFTLDDAHEVVPLLSGTAFYADSPWMAWRTAFREVLKLRSSLPDVENEYRLEKWLAESDVRNGDWSQLGAQDAIEFYESVDGNFEELKKSYEWQWLASYAFMKRKLGPDLQ